MADPQPGLRVLIAAAGAGRRSGLPYPKTLHPVDGVPILGRLLALADRYDRHPTIVVSPAGREPIAGYLAGAGRLAHLVVQDEPRGMGDAVLHLRRSPAGEDAEDVLLMWGDLAMLSPDTIASTVTHHRASGADLTFPTRHVDAAYTRVRRDRSGGVRALEETRELGVAAMPGERDIGVFVFRATPILDLLERDLPGRIGAATGEHGFLYVVAAAVEAGLRVEAVPIALASDLVSLNRLSDLERTG